MDSHKSTQNLIELEQTMPILQDLGIKIEDVVCEDSPDIHIPNFEGKYIGIEVIECYTVDIATNKKQQSHRGNSRLNAICKKYGEKCKKEGKSVDVLLEFYSYAHEVLQGVKYDKKIENEIIDEIERHRETDHIRLGSLDERWEKLNNAGVFNYKYVSSATFLETSLGGVIVSRWEARGVKCIEKEYVESCINEKEKKLPTYKFRNPHIEEFWLCVHVNHFEHRSIMDFEIGNITTNFDRVYLTTRSKVKRIK